MPESRAGLPSAPPGSDNVWRSPAGYCSVVEFAPGELGTPLAEGALPAHIAACVRAAAKGVAPEEGSMPRGTPPAPEVS